jgi:hypothetical protein
VFFLRKHSFSFIKAEYNSIISSRIVSNDTLKYYLIETMIYRQTIIHHIWILGRISLKMSKMNLVPWEIQLMTIVVKLWAVKRQWEFLKTFIYPHGFDSFLIFKILFWWDIKDCGFLIICNETCQPSKELDKPVIYSFSKWSMYEVTKSHESKRAT